MITFNKKGISTVSQVPDRESRLSSQEPPVEIPRYDQASMLVESGNGLGENGTNGLTKKERQLINEQVESLLESKDFSIYQDDYTLADRELMAAYTGAGGKESVGGEGAGLLSEYYTPQIVIDKLWQIAGRLMPNAEIRFHFIKDIPRLYFLACSCKSSLIAIGSSLFKISISLLRASQLYKVLKFSPINTPDGAGFPVVVSRKFLLVISTSLNKEPY